MTAYVFFRTRCMCIISVDGTITVKTLASKFLEFLVNPLLGPFWDTIFTVKSSVHLLSVSS